MTEDRRGFSANYWWGIPEEQRTLDGFDDYPPPPEPDQPAPTPIADLAQDALRRGWVPDGFHSALYVSAGVDTKAPAHLRPELLVENGLSGELAPSFYVYTDKMRPMEDEDFELTHQDDRSEVTTVESRPTDALGVPGALLRLKVVSDRYPDREVAVLRLKIENEHFAAAALAEQWSPEWFVGVCDGCAFGGNPRCENQVVETESSVPMRLKTRFWVTDHFSPTEGDLDLSSERGGGTLSLPNGQTLRQVAFLSSDWVSSHSPLGTRIFEAHLPEETTET